MERLVLEEGATTCRYSQSEKAWIADPQGLSWETFLTTGGSVVHGDGADIGQIRTASVACCMPKTIQSACCLPSRRFRPKLPAAEDHDSRRSHATPIPIEESRIKDNLPTVEPLNGAACGEHNTGYLCLPGNHVAYERAGKETTRRICEVSLAAVAQCQELERASRASPSPPPLKNDLRNRLVK